MKKYVAFYTKDKNGKINSYFEKLFVGENKTLINRAIDYYFYLLNKKDTSIWYYRALREVLMK